jgi:hypothetical protein
MILPGTYANGFAPRDGRPLFPESWRGCVGAWAPSLGPTGFTLRDWGGRNTHGTLTNGATFAVDSQTYQISLGGGSQRVNLGNIPQLQFDFTTPFSISAWIRTTASSGGIVGKRNVTGWYFAIEAANVVGMILQGTPGSAIIVYSVASGVSDGRLRQVGCTYNGSGNASGIELFVNGRKVNKTTILNSSSGTTINSLDTVIGGVSSTDFPLVGSVADVRIYDRVIPDSVFRILGLRPNLAYELAPRRRSALVAGFNRRRRLLVGAH